MDEPADEHTKDPSPLSGWALIYSSHLPQSVLQLQVEQTMLSSLPSTQNPQIQCQRGRPTPVAPSRLSPVCPQPLSVVHPLAAEILTHLRGQWSPVTALLIGQGNFNFMPTWASVY